MNNSLYDEVYDYLKNFQPDTQGLNEYTYYMSSLANIIQMKVNERIMRQGHITDVEKQFWKISEEANKPLKILIAGEFKTGKSTFINTLLGQVILKTDAMPATAVVTHICYGETEALVVELQDGTKWTYPLETLECLTAEGNPYYADLRKKIKIVYVQLPLEFLRYVTLVDSPGINVGIYHHEEATQRAIEEVDFVIWVMKISHAAKKTEIHEIKKLPDYLKPVIIFNGIDLIDEEEEDVNTAIKHAVKRVEKFALCSFAVSAYETQDAIKRNDAHAYAEYKWNAFLQYFIESICKKWFIWKSKAMAGKITKYDSDVLMQHYNEQVDKQRGYLNIIQNSKHHMWLNIEVLRVKRDDLKEIILKSDETIHNLIHSESGSIIYSEIERITSLMQGMGILSQEITFLNPLSREQFGVMQMNYSYYQQYWNYLQNYVNLFNGGNHHAAIVEHLYTAANNFVSCNCANMDMYMQFSKMVDDKENQYYLENKLEIEELKTAIKENEIIKEQLAGFELFTQIQSCINLNI